jgi:hypothetical protein
MLAILVAFAIGMFGGYKSYEGNQTKVDQCVRMVSASHMYGDICAESSSGYENMEGSDAHYTGAMCMARVVRACMDEVGAE